MFSTWNSTVCDRLRRGVAHRAILPVPYPPQKTLFPHGALGEGGKRSHAVRLIALFCLA
ncbi:hypothetical protein [Nostoc favosum]|uniref:Uncharacterized protein n=1 Tax=Nostoc favosum CHAB5714 TaxID=2780399 RepID=A0ABS8IBL7_9NOSO|nr:hypothetical protein [Nostoc favosum]MCC5601587.1 hypothetical protein [Nostoc favosum CHAB5714]